MLDETKDHAIARMNIIMALAQNIIEYDRETLPGAIQILLNALKQDQVHCALDLMYIDYNERAGYDYLVRAVKVAAIILDPQLG